MLTCVAQDSTRRRRPFESQSATARGRRLLDGNQELNYRNIIEVLADLNYQGFVGHEFFLSRRGPGFALQCLRRAVELCDV